jgi:predicted nucleic acid-binding protein
VVRVYVDTSVLVSALFQEPSSASVVKWLGVNRGEAIVGDLTALEFASAVSRGLRTNRLERAEANEILEDFDDLRAACERARHSGADFELAQQLVRDFETKLAGPDALHLATAINIGAALATLDGRLVEAARLRGVPSMLPG